MSTTDRVNEEANAVIATDVQIEQLARDGFAVIPDLIGDVVVNGLVAIMESAGATYGRRNLLADFEEVRSVARSDPVRSFVESVLGPNVFAVRGIFFDKTADANWKVDWHQDRTIAVHEKRDVPGFSLWTAKGGVTHVQPPFAILEQMLTVRLHLDEADESNGALRVIPSSHRSGFIAEEAVSSWVQRHDSATCPVSRGGAVVMRPLLLHASSKATRPSHRRVLHLEFAARPLPSGLEWAIRV
jgi:ectoine hydroxylase-related dioxygenase (phytanoyl-CoA dioxygenase family)